MRMKTAASLLALALVVANRAEPAPAEAPQLLLSDGRYLAALRERARAGDPQLAGALGRLRKAADEALTQGPWSVVDKTRLPPGADPHDYRSLGPYWWPDPSKPDGLPYIRKDGERNPEAGTDAYDSPRFSRLRNAVGLLGLAYFLTGHEPYAERAALLLRTWFLGPRTRMNPHLRYGQAIPGITDGRGIGIIDTARVPELLDRVELLRGSPAWAEADRRGLLTWMSAYLDWLLTSGHGKDEAKTTNNHGTWYDVQVAGLALRAGRRELAREHLDKVTRGRIASQLEPDGRQPRELERTRALSYSLFNLEAFFCAATLGERVRLDLWSYRTSDGRSLRRALDFLLPHSDPNVKWPHAQITEAPWATFAKLLAIAVTRYSDPRYAEALRRLPPASRDVPEGLLFPAVEPR